MVVDTANGRLRGARDADSDLRRFLGIRYAEAPVGDLRWRAPQPAQPWVGVRDALGFADAAMQQVVTPTSLYYGGESRLSEDCLFLNVWTGAAEDAGRPVLVWLHYGGFQFGSASNPVYDGAALASAGATVVTINYRVGRFGFLAHPDLTAETDTHASGNYGLLDQLDALRWVQCNIAAFGGNPTNVTLIGCSAGAISTWLLRSSPLSKGLFHRAVAHSGLGFAHSTDGPGQPGVLQTLNGAERAGQELCDAIGVDGVEALRRTPAESILAARLPRQHGVWRLPFLPPETGVSTAPFDTAYPIVDGYVLPRSPREVFANGDQLDVPLLAGNTANEASGLPYLVGRQNYYATMRDQYQDFADELLALYPAADDDQARTSSNRLLGDRMFAWGTWKGLRLDSRTGNAPTYSYFFTRVPPIPTDTAVAEEGRRVGAYHGADVPYVFSTLDARDWPWTEGDRLLSDRIRHSWVAFARTGDPNGEGLPTWPEFDGTSTNSTMLLDLEPKVGDRPERERLDFWDKFYENPI